jgi:hypothetical protein
MGKKSPAPPPAPDYATLAVKQGEANLAAAKQSAYMSNPNIYGPTGSQEVTWTKTPTIDTDAYNKAMQQWRENMMTNPQYAGAQPSQEDFTTFIEQPTVRQTINPDAEAALRQQELAQFYMSKAAAGAASGLGDLGIASAFRPTDIPNLVYGAIGPYDAVSRPTNITNWGQAQALQQGAGGAIEGAPTAPFSVVSAYPTDLLPQPVNEGQQARADVPIQGAIMAPGSEYYGRAGAGPAAPTDLGQLQAGQFAAQSAPSGQAFGTAQGGPSGGLYGLAGAGPQGLNLQGLNLSGLGGVAGGPQQGEFGYAQRFVQGPQLQGQIDVSGIAQGPVNAGMTAQQAIMSRLSPQIATERQQLQTQLINQGLRPGGEAYNAAMSAQMQKENDLILQAAAQGISLDQAARQQQFAEQQSRAMFANQAALSGFGAGMEQAGLYNLGAQQDLQSSLATQAAQNQAQQQAFQQRLQAGEFGQEAQLASFGTQQQAQQAANQAIAQNFAQAQAAQQMQNQAMGQNFEQALASQQAQNAAMAQNYQQALGAGQFNREALLQQFGMGQSAQELANQAIAQNYQQSLAQTEAQNQALQQIFGQGVTQQELQNAAAAQNFQQMVGAQQANLARQAQQSRESQELAQFYNQSQAQAYQQELAYQAAANAAQQQRFGQQMDIQAAQNAALAQRQQTELDYFNTLNALQQQQYNQALAQAQFQNTAAQQALAQQAAIRSMPVNEISALLSGGQVSVPQFQGYSGVNVAPPPIFQAGQAAGNFAQQNYANQVGAYNAGMGMLGSLAGAAGTAIGGAGSIAGLFSDRRLKSNVVRVGTHPLGIGIYEYDIFGERQRGVMADEVETVMPEAVATHSSGYKMVNYGLL